MWNRSGISILHLPRLLAASASAALAQLLRHRLRGGVSEAGGTSSGITGWLPGRRLGARASGRHDKRQRNYRHLGKLHIKKPITKSMPPRTELFLMICIVLTPSIRPGGISVVQKHTPVGHSPNYDCVAATRGGGCGGRRTHKSFFLARSKRATFESRSRCN
jgi:hypothetical protein